VRFSVRTRHLYWPKRWSPERVAQVQQRRLSQLVRYAARRSPFYRWKYRGIDLNSPRLEQLPTTYKDEIRQNFEHVVTDPAIRREDVERFIADRANLGQWYLGKYAVSHTSGSQGSPLLILQDRSALEKYFSILSSRVHAHGTPGLGEAIRRLRQPVRVAVVA
jgi:phenylacetate-coenzyme A ligase PaaK-like adenylate-forming protein